MKKYIRITRPRRDSDGGIVLKVETYQEKKSGKDRIVLTQGRVDSNDGKFWPEFCMRSQWYPALRRFRLTKKSMVQVYMGGTDEAYQVARSIMEAVKGEFDPESGWEDSQVRDEHELGENKRGSAKAPPG